MVQEIDHDSIHCIEPGKSSESVQCAMLKACDACADVPVIAHCTDSESEDFPRAVKSMIGTALLDTIDIKWRMLSMW